VAILAAATRSDLRERNGQAELALRDGERQLNAGHFGEAVQTFDRGLALARRVPFSSGLERRMRDRHAVAMRRHLADRLHQLADQARILYGSRSAPDESPRAVALECRAFWSRRGLLMNLLGEADNAAAGDDLRDIAIFAASLPAESEADRAAAQRLLDEVEATFGPSAVLEFERSAHRPGAVARDSSPAPEARTAWEHCALGRAFLSSGGTSAAARHLSAALALDPAGRWTNFYFGQCAYRTGRYEDAVAAFSVCIGSAPDVAASYYNRGLALGALGRDEQALRDFDRALQLDPHLADAALRRDRLRGGGVSE